HANRSSPPCPTRRSSDLLGEVLGHGQPHLLLLVLLEFLLLLGLPGLLQVVVVLDRLLPLHRSIGLVVEEGRVLLLQVLVLGEDRDRKSTRLNSSHVAISY